MKHIIQIGIIAVLLVFSPDHSFAKTSGDLSTTDPFALSFTGPEETVIPHGEWGLNWLPDENISFIKSGGNVHVWFAAGKESYYLRGPTFESLLPHQVDVNGNAVPVLLPSGSGFDRDYAGSASVIRAANGSDLLMFYHAEDQTCGGDNAKVGIGLARSSDGGATWTKQGQIISSPQVPTDCNYSGFRGAGNPSVLISQDGQYIYMYYMEWLSTRPDSISLARAARTSDGTPGSWFKYSNASFSEPGLGGASDAVIQRANATAGYAGIPNVTYNSFLQKYLAIVVGHNGFYHTSSADGINWNTPTLFWEVPALTYWNNLNDGDSWYYYPTLISTTQDTDDTSVRTGYLYYAHGVKNGPPHYMVRRPILIEEYRVYLPILIRANTN